MPDQQILRSFLDEQRQSSPTPHAQGHTPELDYVTLAGMTEGYTASDISDLVDGAMQQSIIHSGTANESKVSAR